MPLLNLPKLSSLRARLVASHASVIVVALLIVLVVSAGWLRRAEQGAQIAELRDLAVPLLTETRIITREGRTVRTRVLREEIVEDLFVRQAEDMDLRILVLDPTGLVLLDTGTATPRTGETLAPYAAWVSEIVQRAERQGDIVGRAIQPRGRPADEPFRDQVVYIAASGRAVESGADSNVLMLVEPPRSTGIVARFLPPLVLALLIALAIALATGYVISRRLSGPVLRMTAAARAMASGNLEQRVPDDGPGEIGHLGASFNTMSHRVAATDRAQRALLADVSHELRTPLTNVDGYAQALRDGMFTTDAEREAAYDTISSEAGRMRTLINDLLELARLESGQMRLNTAAVAADTLLSDTSHRFAARAAEGKVSIRVESPPHLSISADRDRLDRALDNLVGNALRHTPSGGEIVLSAGALPPSERARRIQFQIRDTGSGIPPDRLASVFNRFARASDDRDGFGLGLPITRELVELHGGTITIESQPGAGTTVTVVLPVDASADRRQ